MALEEENTTLRRKSHLLQERLSTVKATPQQPRDSWFGVQVLPMQPLFTPDQGGLSSQPPVHQAATASMSATIPPGTVVGHDSIHMGPPGTSIVQPATALLVHLPPPLHV